MTVTADAIPLASGGASAITAVALQLIVRIVGLASITALNLEILKPFVLKFAANLRMGRCLAACSRPAFIRLFS